MLITNFLNSRKSVRDYKNKEVKKDDMVAIQKGLDDRNLKSSKYQFTLHTNGDDIYKALDGHGGYGGVMIKAPAYIAMNVLEEHPQAYLEASYAMEDLETMLADLGLGSCWVTLLEASDVLIKDTFKNPEGRIKYLLATGYPSRSFNFGSKDFVPKIGVEDYVFRNLEKEPYTMEELEHFGLDDLFYYLRMAPSSKDRQPWRFIIQDNYISLYADDINNLDDFVDIGIVIYYFDSLAKASNFNPVWEIDIKDAVNGLTYIGRTRF